jgi:hemerythrin-like domain-containing protein
VTNRLHADHQRISGLLHQYEIGEHTEKTGEVVLQQICQELLHHMELEENKVYPIIRRVLSEPEQPQIDTSLREHERIKELIRHIEEHTSGEDKVTALVQKLQNCVRQHAQEEEQEVLPKAEERGGPEFRQLAYELRLDAPDYEPRVHVDQQDPSPV